MSKNKNVNLFNDVAWRIDEEGIDYCFESYSDWEDIKDEDFHYLRLKYLEVARELREYVEARADEDYGE